VIPLFIRKISRGEPITVFGKDKVLDFTYIDDCVDGVRRGIDLLVGGGEANQTVNLAYGQGTSLVRMAEYIGEALGVQPNMTIQPSRTGEVTRYIANIGKATALLGYRPTTPLREGITKAVAWSMDWWATHETPKADRGNKRCSNLNEHSMN
jgi:nucleoside-diphosphate-sugar epimerase